MRHLFCYILLSLWGIYASLASISVTRDSLLNVAAHSTDVSRRIMAYRNLADLYFEEPEEVVYLHKMYHAAKESHDKGNMLDGLSDLSYTYVKALRFDSVSYYMNLMERTGSMEETIPYLSYLRMRTFEVKARNNRATEAIAEELAVMNDKNIDKNNIYVQIEQAYTTGCALYNEGKTQEAYPFWKRAYELSTKLSFERGYELRTFVLWNYANSLTYQNKGEEFIKYIEELRQLYKNNYERYYVHQRPFYNIDVRYLQCYTALFMAINKLPEDKINYYFDLINEMRPRITKDVDKYNCFLAMNNYYLHKKDYPNALATNDSLIKYAWMISPSNVPGLLEISSQIYEAMGNYKDAFRHHKYYTQVQDSLTSSEFKEQLGELQVKYEIDKLNYENSTLANKNKRILLIALSSVLFLVIGVCVYLYYDLKRERRMKKKLSELNKKAGESEKLKTAFVNSMCHEIRTPLNAIVGFSGIITDDTLGNDEAMKMEYYNLITVNAQVLTSLIDHLLVVANLDSSEELLPCERTDIKNICRQEMEKVKRQAKPEITYRLDLPDEEIFISTNEQYLSLVIENLLNNANKFTEKGTISLDVWLDKTQGRLQLTVTDTGCGIPSGKHDVVFQRFSKLDEYVQGNGLGLYLSRLIVTRLSGSIFVDPSYTDGARLVVNLPI
ncbi:MAG: HAMP domain-containing histidine kinase [Bacteroides sp.]|nr:HAMP domain-containing histidine kinase [Bacteroides sp.]